eukprot:CAMPEP_0175747912 /NCGR_PEP_ID=MMETSP0097-20121207/59347_1 /TAXON_ID=311494 /ORGANISM="Alexandrium monilatum, Strain CCMP3105" /LENGTH=35 /DNA_ID= /DNA_START= /DNA_END= /DNA_ORIENTATION=
MWHPGRRLESMCLVHMASSRRCATCGGVDDTQPAR